MENNNSFEHLGLFEDLIKGVYLYGFTQPSKIQIKGIEAINSGKDCILQSQSGTGKTAMYLLGVLNRLCNNNTNAQTQGVIITPTRELATQVYDVAIQLSKHTTFNIVKCIGGTDIFQNKQELKSANLIIGTLGRIHHMIEDKKINMTNLSFLVLDEADEILSDGNYNKNNKIIHMSDKLKYIFDSTLKTSQLIFISATMTDEVFNASKKYMNEPNKVLLKNNEVIVDLIKQFYLDVESEEYKFDTLLDLYNLISTSQAIIFCNTIRKVEWLEQNLKQNNFSITVIHSNMTQEERHNVVQEFRQGHTRLLLTTDLLSRGIDIPQVNLVVNYDLPADKETYVHRIGRCGRFDKTGVSITMVKMKDMYDLRTFNKMKNHYRINIRELPADIDSVIKKL
jgi:superfamily II DNA/RNA helicase